MNITWEHVSRNKSTVFWSMSSVFDWNAAAYQKTTAGRICLEVFGHTKPELVECVLIYLREKYIFELDDGSVICPPFVWPDKNTVPFDANPLMEGDLF